jgi:hypothetical protein
MSLEETDTTGFEKKPIPGGEDTFKVLSVNRVEKVKGLYEWQLENSKGDDYQHNMFANEMGDLLRILGCNETSKNKFSWDTVAVEDRTFKATVSHVPDKKDANIIRQKMTNFKADDGIPF